MNPAKTIQMVVFDWAGTTVDYGSSAPAQVFEQIFRQEGIHFTRQEINGPMGMEKKDHIRALLSSTSGRQQWEQIHGAAWTEEDVERLYQNFEAALFQMVADRSQPLDGVAETVAALREQGLKIGSTTGYTSHMMEQVLPGAAAGGYAPDCVVTPDVVGSGRPGPFMLFACMRQLQVYPPRCVVKVGDTVADIREGKNAGAWSVGLLTGSNLVGLTEEEAAVVSPEEWEQRRTAAADRYREAGADLVLDSIRDLPRAVEELNRRLAKEEEA